VRQDLRSQATGCLCDLLGSLEHKNSWQLSEQLGREKPYGIQRLLGRARGDADEVRDALIRYAAKHLIGPDEAAIKPSRSDATIEPGNEQRNCGINRAVMSEQHAEPVSRNANGCIRTMGSV